MRSNTPEQLSFADLEHEREGTTREPLLETISWILDQIPDLAESIRRDLQAGVTNPHRGRKGLGPEAVLRSIILWRIKDLPYRELSSRIGDGYEFRTFVRLRGRAVPKHNSFQRAFSTIRPETMKEIIDRITLFAVREGFDDGKNVRVDGTVVETNIHFPTDAWLMWDAVRVLTRLVKRVGELAPGAVKGFHDRTRRAKRLFFLIQRPSTRMSKKKRTMRANYLELIRITNKVVEAAEFVASGTKDSSFDITRMVRLEGLEEEIRKFVSLSFRVVDQARRRILLGEKVPAKEKIVSIFEPHTDIIVRNKQNKPVEFGHKIELSETAAGLSYDHEVMVGNPPEPPWVEKTLKRHRELYSDHPEVFAADRGFYSAASLNACNQAEVDLEAIPYKGRRRPDERSEQESRSDFKAALRFRNGIEGRISGLARGRGMTRCRLKGKEGFDFFVAASILASNLMCLARAVDEKSDKKTSTTAA